MDRIWNWVAHHLQSVFLPVFQASIEAWDTVRDRILIAIFINLLALSGVFVCAYYGLKNMAVAISVISSIMIFLVWVACSAIARGVQIQDASVAGEVRKLISPLLSASLMMSFIAYYLAMPGTLASVFSAGFLVIALVGYFFLLFCFYIGRDTKFTGYLMAGVVIFMTFQTYAPEQYRYLSFVIDSLANYSRSVSTDKIGSMNVDSSARYATVIESGVLYDETGKPAIAGYDKDGKPIKNILKVNTLVMVVGQQKEADLKAKGEPMASVILANEDGDFVNNAVHLFPHRKLGKQSKTSDFNQAKTAATRTIVWEQTISPTPEKIRTGLSVKDGGSFMITTDKPFYIVEGDGKGSASQLVKIDGPVKNREHYYKFGGGISVKAIEPNTRLEIRIL